MREQNPDSTAEPKHTVLTKISTEWKQEDIIHLTERRCLTTHYCNNANWHVTQDAEILPNTIRHREAALICEVVRIADVRNDLHLPGLTAHTTPRVHTLVGMTEVMWSDNGPEYVHEVGQNLAGMLGSVWNYSLTYRPQANGIAERVNGEILKHVHVLLCWLETWRRRFLSRSISSAEPLQLP